MRHVLVLALLVAGCAAQRQPLATVAPPSAAAPAPASAASAPGTVAPPVLLTPPAEPEPVLSTTGDDYLAVLASIEEYRSWLFRHPDPAGLGAIFDSRCTCTSTDGERLAQHAEQGRWWIGAPPRVVGVEVLDAHASDVVVLRATSVRNGTSQLVDATGAVHESHASQGEWLTDYVLVREDPTAPWKVRDVVLQGGGEQ
jgi:hypothetical protein